MKKVSVRQSDLREVARKDFLWLVNEFNRVIPEDDRPLRAYDKYDRVEIIEGGDIFNCKKHTILLPQDGLTTRDDWSVINVHDYDGELVESFGEKNWDSIDRGIIFQVKTGDIQGYNELLLQLLKVYGVGVGQYRNKPNFRKIGDLQIVKLGQIDTKKECNNSSPNSKYNAKLFAEIYAIKVGCSNKSNKELSQEYGISSARIGHYMNYAMVCTKCMGVVILSLDAYKKGRGRLSDYDFRMHFLCGDCS